MIGRERGHPAPVVDPGVEQGPLLLGVGQVRRRLDVHPGPEHEPCRRDRGQELLVPWLRGVLHRRPGLGPEVLHDDLLHVPVAPMQLADREQRRRTFGEGLADPHEDPRGERDRQAPGVLDHAESNGGNLVR